MVDSSNQHLKPTHKLEHLRQLLQRNSLERSLDQATRVEVNGLNAILAVTDIAALDADHLDNGFENGGLQEYIGGKADGNNSTSRASVFDSLMERLFRNSKQEHSVSTQATGCSSLNISNKIARLGEVDVGLNTILARTLKI